MIAALVRQRLEIVDPSPEAQQQGVRIGMTLAEARALCPNLRALDHEPAADLQALEALGRWMMRFTPDVALRWVSPSPQNGERAGVRGGGAKQRGSDQAGSSASSPVSNTPAFLILNVTGCERLFGGIDAIADHVAHALDQFAIRARLAVAPTPGAAWALAAFSTGGIVEAKNLLAAVAPLPVAALRVDSPIVQALHHVGLQTIGQVLKLPRDTLPARFGPMLLRRIDQLIGARLEPLISLADQVPIAAFAKFETPIESSETLRLIAGKLLERVVAQLLRHGRGARKIELICRPDRASRGEVVTKSILLSRPSRDAKNLFRLIECATENLSCRGGFVRVELRAAMHERISETQILLHDAEQNAGEIEFHHLIERLRVQLGERAIVMPALTESRLPERAWRAKTSDENDRQPFVPPVNERPLQLLPVPVEVQVIVRPTNHLEGKPAQFTHGRQVHRLIHVIGPERIAGEWWRGHFKTRDYFDVDDEDGQRFWIFRVVAHLAEETFSARWFLHGVFG